MESDRLDRLAELAVGFGANVQPGQVVRVRGDLGHEPLARAIAAASYRRGARFVDVEYFDPYVKRARIEHAPEETLGFVPSWYGERVLALGRERGASIAIVGPTAPGSLDGLDPARAGRDQLPFVPESMVVINERTVNWTAIPCPTPAWAHLVHAELDGEVAHERLWEEVAHVCRLDEDDPIRAWDARFAVLERAAGRLGELRLDAVHYEGPGTDLTIGLLPSSIWRAARFSTVDGLVHHPNVPTEEVYTTPDPERAEGRVRSTRPLVLLDGTIIRGLEVRFEGGRAVEFTAEEGAQVLRGRAAIDEGASRLGEVALVDRESRIGGLRTTFFTTLLDENASSHIALGDGLNDTVDEADVGRVNRSAIHVDFMVGGEDVAVTGITRAGDRVPLLRKGIWAI